jgi:hypothetical protein
LPGIRRDELAAAKVLRFGALAANVPVTDEGSTSSFSTRLPLSAQVVVNSGKAKRPLTADSTSRWRSTSAPVASHVPMHEVGADSLIGRLMTSLRSSLHVGHLRAN